MLDIKHCLCPKNRPRKTQATVDKETIKEHIYYLASDELRGRDTGSPEILEAAAYIENELKSYGAEPVPGSDGYFQPVPLRKNHPQLLPDLVMQESHSI